MNTELMKLIKAEDIYNGLDTKGMYTHDKVSLLMKICFDNNVSCKGLIFLENKLILNKR